MVRLLNTSAFLVALAAIGLAGPALAGDAASGKTVFFQYCSACHATTKGAPSGLGPSLFGVVGRKAGSLPGYAYSPAMKAADYSWTTDRLAAYLPAPMKVVPGTKMTFAGLKRPGQADDVIAYLSSLK